MFVMFLLFAGWLPLKARQRMLSEESTLNPRLWHFGQRQQFASTQFLRDCQRYLTVFKGKFSRELNTGVTCLACKARYSCMFPTFHARNTRGVTHLTRFVRTPTSWSEMSQEGDSHLRRQSLLRYPTDRLRHHSGSQGSPQGEGISQFSQIS